MQNDIILSYMNLPLFVDIDNFPFLKQAQINNRRYLGNKFALSEFITQVVNENCQNIKTIVDIFSGTGAVANLFLDKTIITNDLLYSNYICHCAWFLPKSYNQQKIIQHIEYFNNIQTTENNYMRQNFADTFFSADNCSKIGFVREAIEKLYQKKQINFKEYAILITSLLYGMDKIANTVGHYDAYRKNLEHNKSLIIPLILPNINIQSNNQCFNQDANILIKTIECDLLYLDPPYNSRQYSDAYHLLENVAKWEKPEVFGVARKMNRSHIKSNYCTISATNAFEELIHHAKAKYILLSYNNMAEKGNERSNAKISDADIIRILEKKGKVSIFTQKYKSFTTGKSNIENNEERLFLCEVFDNNQPKIIQSPLNYTGGKHQLLPQILPLFAQTECFIDLFAGGANVAINSQANHIIINDKNSYIIELFRLFKHTSIEKLLSEIDETITQYQLSNSHQYGYGYYHCDSKDGLASYNKDKFANLRADYNQTKSILLLYVLIIYSFNNQIRFNQKGEFNLPVGKRDFNLKMQSKLKLFVQALQSKNISFSNQDFRDFDLDDLPKDSLIYCDPPYLITLASYNENNGWNEQDELDLLVFLDKVHQKGFKFALSNVILAKNKENHILMSWLKRNHYICHYLDKSYANSNYQRKDKDSKSIEVLITNY